MYLWSHVSKTAIFVVQTVVADSFAVSTLPLSLLRPAPADSH